MLETKMFSGNQGQFKLKWLLEKPDITYPSRNSLKRNLMSDTKGQRRKITRNNAYRVSYTKKILFDRRYDESLSIYSKLIGMTI